ncbi:uncharacterized protein DEA37_0002788 [Paragonimus westermani]|uniref:Integrase catalytic domain-containing protein n=1 Tax=Paragonimus westermani TaxID=34504 RepID=A0A5J4P1Y5_9TREM|nr:uncharacterized protein DEA37_0002788 [Paragonimus westermani]
MPNQEASKILSLILEEWVARFGTRIELHSDQGAAFKSRLLEEWKISTKESKRQWGCSRDNVYRLAKLARQKRSRGNFTTPTTIVAWEEQMIPPVLQHYQTLLYSPKNINRTEKTYSSKFLLILIQQLALSERPLILFHSQYDLQHLDDIPIELSLRVPRISLFEGNARQRLPKDATTFQHMASSTDVVLTLEAHLPIKTGRETEARDSIKVF